ncbi:hypothetical protein BDA99DRAFT_547799 [Phascolomyces articulosus]|uniref:MYND-type domain-containing protein n=1 Tax=Phascolomyces articulosus TaxID=60185 RepID=A0AAD5K9J8_9FUNG|nr:hypothetical protein BDA99DRAFT_547799 [Phascolomyces articulosus]
MAQVIEQTANEPAPATEIPAFLGLTQQKSALLVALYNETDPDFAKQIPTALPIAAQQLAAEYEKRNSVGKKLERAEGKFLDEYKEFETIQQEAVERLSKTDMNIGKAAEGLDLEGKNRHDLLLGSFLYGGVRREASGPEDRASMSPVASPNFEGAKKLMERAMETGCTMAGVQIGSFYVQEDKLAGGKNMKKGEDCKKLAYEFYKKAADLGNPMACHKVAFFSENGYGCEQNLDRAIEYYIKAYEQGYPDSAHNLGLIYQGHTQATASRKELKKALTYLEQGKQWGYAPSANALGRLYLLMSKNSQVAKDAGVEVDDKDEYVVTGIDFMEYAADNGDADAMLMLGLIFGSKEYGLYDMDKAQNYMELALVRGDPEAYTYLVRILRAKMAARAALEQENLDNFDKLSLQDQAKLIRQVAKEATPEKVRHRQCSSTFCTNQEEKEGDFKKCGRCQRVSYCSRDCQKEHWKHGHKAVCTAPSATDSPSSSTPSTTTSTQ